MMNKTCRTYSRARRIHETSRAQASNRCRLCMAQDDPTAMNIFEDKDEPMTSAMINFTTGLLCVESDGLPAKLCSTCYHYVLNFYAFKKMCLASFEKLRKNFEFSKLQIDVKDSGREEPRFVPEIENSRLPHEQLIDIDQKSEDLENSFVLGQHNIHPDAPDEVMFQVVKTEEEFGECGVLIDDEDKGDERLNCCGVRFDNLASLAGHHRELHKIVRFYCDVCYKGFKSKSAVVRHFPVHTGYRPFKCETCGKGFSQKESLTRHMPIHTDRRIECEQCGKILLSLDGLKCHIKTAHTPRSPEEMSKYKCKWCHKVFMHASGLSRHTALHNGIRYFCDECERIFNDSSQLKRHISKAHPPNTPPVIIA